MAALALLAALRKPASLAVLADPQWEALSLLHGSTLAHSREVNARPVVASGSSEPKRTSDRDDRAQTHTPQEVAA